MKLSATSLLAVGATQPLAADRFSPLSRVVTRCRLRGNLVGSCRSQARPPLL